MDDTSRQHPDPAIAASLAERVQRLEESLAFAQRDSDETLTQLLAIDARVRELSRRLERLEKASEQRAAEKDSLDEPQESPSGPIDEP